MTDPDVAAVQERAHALWHEAGCPDGQDQHFWLTAESDLSTGPLPRAVEPGADAPGVVMEAVAPTL